jgi:hypothetical protein
MPGLLPLRDLYSALAFNLIALLKPLDAPLGIQHPALTGEKRMAFAANLDAQLLSGGAGGELVTAGTDYLGIIEILGVNFFFHRR